MLDYFFVVLGVLCVILIVEMRLIKKEKQLKKINSKNSDMHSISQITKNHQDSVQWY